MNTGKEGPKVRNVEHGALSSRYTLVRGVETRSKLVGHYPGTLRSPLQMWRENTLSPFKWHTPTSVVQQEVPGTGQYTQVTVVHGPQLPNRLGGREQQAAWQQRAETQAGRVWRTWRKIPRR